MAVSYTHLHQTAVYCLDRNTLIGEFLFGEGRAKSLDGAAADHTRYTLSLIHIYLLLIGSDLLFQVVQALAALGILRPLLLAAVIGRAGLALLLRHGGNRFRLRLLRRENGTVPPGIGRIAALIDGHASRGHLSNLGGHLAQQIPCLLYPSRCV